MSLNHERRIPANPQGEPNDDKLSRIDDYIRDHIGITPTKYASEEQKACPPIDLAQTAQRLMAQDHQRTYGGFSQGFSSDFDQDFVTRVLGEYRSDMVKVPADYGAVPGADIDDYFNVGINRQYELIRDEVLDSSEEQSVASTFLHVIEKYRSRVGIEPWEAARLAIRLIRKQMPSMIERSRQLSLDKAVDKRLITRQVFLEFLNSQAFELHLQMLAAEIQEGRNLTLAFNYLLKEGEEVTKQKDGGLEMFDEDFQKLCVVYHLAERPYTKAELLMGQELLDNDPNFKAALIVFHYQLMKFIAGYLAKHPERLAHSFEFMTEIFLTVEGEGGEVTLIPNPKLMKVVSRNVVPAIARAYLADGATDLTEQHIAQGAVTAKDLLLFQTFIGEFHAPEDAEDGVSLHSFFSQTCPAMQPFSKALIEALPPIYRNCKDKNITIKE